jgi:hypothetical protein
VISDIQLWEYEVNFWSVSVSLSALLQAEADCETLGIHFIRSELLLRQDFITANHNEASNIRYLSYQYPKQTT